VRANSMARQCMHSGDSHGGCSRAGQAYLRAAAPCVHRTSAVARADHAPPRVTAASTHAPHKRARRTTDLLFLGVRLLLRVIANTFRRDLAHGEGRASGAARAGNEAQRTRCAAGGRLPLPRTHTSERAPLVLSVIMVTISGCSGATHGSTQHANAPFVCRAFKTWTGGPWRVFACSTELQGQQPAPL
jgi:hypothetical protein